MKFKFRKKVSVKLREKIKASEFLLSVDYEHIQKKDLDILKSYMNIVVDNLTRNADLLKDYKLNDYLRLQFDKAYCNLYNLKIYEVSEIVSLLSQNNENSVDSVINNNLTLKQGIEKYLKDVEINNDLEKLTLHSYSLKFKHLVDFFTHDKIIKDIVQDDVEKFNEMLSNRLKTSSRKSLITFYKNFFNFLVTKKDLVTNEFNTIKIKGSVESDKEPFKQKEVIKLLDLANRKVKKQKKDINLNLTCHLAAFSGMRVSEIANIRLKDVDLKNKFIYVSLKDTLTKKHQRFIPVHKTLVSLIKKAMKNKKQDEFLVYNNFSEKSKMSNINQDTNQYFIKKHISNKNLSFHSFRHSFRTQLQMKNPELETYIDILMAHTNKNQSIGFSMYGHNSADWNKLVKLINEIDYKEHFNNNFQQMFLDKVV